MTTATTARDIRTAAENLAQSHTEWMRHYTSLYSTDATEEQRVAAEYWRDAAIADGEAWINTWSASGYANEDRKGYYRACRIYDLAATRYAQITERI